MDRKGIEQIRVLLLEAVQKPGTFREDMRAILSDILAKVDGATQDDVCAVARSLGAQLEAIGDPDAPIAPDDIRTN